MKIQVMRPAVAVALGLLSISSPFAARAIQGTVGQVSAADAAALGQVGFRIWSALPGGTTDFNRNVTSCRNVRCLRSYVTNTTLAPGGYVGNPEATQVYNGDIPDQPFYELVDSSMHDAAANHIGFYGVSGVAANGTGIGNFLAAGCAGTTATNCFPRLDSSLAAPPLSDTYAGYGGAPNTIRAIGGLNPIPNVRIDSIVMGVANLSWNDPPTYVAAMRQSSSAPAPPSPVRGVHLWQVVRIGNCNSPAGNDPDWASVSSFDLGQTTAQVALNLGADCTFFALTVRLIGPGGLPNEIETFRVGVSSFPAITDCIDYRNCADDFNPCTEDICLDGGCQHFPVSAICDDGNLCTLSDACNAGVCGGVPKDCADTTPCTDDSCNPATGQCIHAANTAPFCDDGNACTLTDTCSGGQCVGSSPRTCDDANPCTNDSCSPATGCVNVSNTASCDDANSCTINDVCSGGACGGTLITYPPEVTHDRFPTKTTFLWDQVAGAVPGTVYDVVRGRANELPSGTGPNDTCRAVGITQLSIGVGETPPIGKALWYVVRARNSCGAGTYGNWSNGIPRFADVCP